MAHPVASALVREATAHPSRQHRDVAFEALLRDHPEQLAGVLDQSPGLSERQVRVRRVAQARGVDALALLAQVAAHDPSILVRTEAIAMLAHMGPPAADALLCALDTALVRGERPGGTLADPVGLLVQGVARMAPAHVEALWARARRQPHPALGRAVLDALAAHDHTELLQRAVHDLSPTAPHGHPATRAQLHTHALTLLLELDALPVDERASLAVQGPSESVRLLALADLDASHPAALAAADAVLTDPSADICAAGCAVLVRAGAPGLERLEQHARTALPQRSPAWEALLDHRPSTCTAILSAMPTLGHQLGLLPAPARTPGALAVVHAIATGAGDVRLRHAATVRIDLHTPAGRAMACTLWVQAVHWLQAPAAAVRADDAAWARRAHDHLHDRLVPPDPLVRAVQALGRAMDPAELDRQGRALARVLSPDAPEGAPSYLGLAYDPDPDTRLMAMVGLCAWPASDNAALRRHRASSERDPVLAWWTLLAALSTEGVGRSQPPAMPPGRHAAELGALTTAFQALDPTPSPAEQQLQRLLELDQDDRIGAILALGAQHPGYPLRRAQAEELGRALNRGTRGRSIVTLLLQHSQRLAIRQALRIARRSVGGGGGGGGGGGSGRSGGRRAAAEAWSDAVAVHQPPEAAPPVEDDTDEDTWDTDVSRPTLGPDGLFDWERPLPVPTLAASTVVRPLAPDATALVEHLAATVGAYAPGHGHDDRTDDAPEPGTPRFHEGVSADQLTHIDHVLRASLAVRWQALFPGMAVAELPHDYEVHLWSPTTLRALQLYAAALDGGVLPPEPEFGPVSEPPDLPTQVLQALEPELRLPPPQGADLDHIGQVIWALGQAAPGACSQLVADQGAHHPGWRTLVHAAWLAYDGYPEDRWGSPGAPPKPLSLHAAAARSTLCERLATQHGAFECRSPEQRAQLRHTPTWRRRPAPPVGAMNRLDLGSVAVPLTMGALSFRRMAYPTFRVAARAGLRLHALYEGHRKLAATYMDLDRMHQHIVQGRVDRLLDELFAGGLTLATIVTELRVLPAYGGDLPWWWETPDLFPPADEDLDLPPPEDDYPPFPPCEDLDYFGRALSADETPGLDHLPSWQFRDDTRLPGLRHPYLERDCPRPSWWDGPQRSTMLAQLDRDARAYVQLRSERPGNTRINRKTTRRLWRRLPEDQVPPLSTRARQDGPDLVVEGLVHALLLQLVDFQLAPATRPASDKEHTVRVLRDLALLHGFSRLPFHDRLAVRARVPDSFEDDGRAEQLDLALSNEHVRAVIEHLYTTFRQRSDELTLALGLTDGHGLPKLLGGAPTPLEQAGHRLLHKLSGSADRQADPSSPPRWFECVPLSKHEALHRGDLGGDCSSRTVPFRCLSPHHTYYGIFEDGVQQRGYITVFEAWARQPDGSHRPSLCLETINVPIPIFDAIQLDLLHLLEAVAHSRGLAPHLAMVTDSWAWNYPNGRALRRSRPAREGSDTAVQPADPWSWSVYEQALSDEAGTYTPFRTTATCRLLAATDVDQDALQPENAAEATRLRGLEPRELHATAWEDGQVRGFISEWPT